MMVFFLYNKKIEIYFYTLKIRGKKLRFLNFYFFLINKIFFFIKTKLIKLNLGI